MKILSKKDINKISGGDLIEYAPHLLCTVVVFGFFSRFINRVCRGYQQAASYQDGYQFTGVEGSGYETEFVTALNEELHQKDVREKLDKY